MGLVKRFDVYLVNLDPVVDGKAQTARPCVIVSPDDVNDALATVIIAPMTTVRRRWPTRPAVTFQGKTGEIALDQIRAVDKTRLVKRLGRIDLATATAVLDTLGELFAPCRLAALQHYERKHRAERYQRHGQRFFVGHNKRHQRRQRRREHVERQELRHFH